MDLPPNHSTHLDDVDLSLVPFANHQCGPKGQEVPFYLSDLSSDANLDLDDNARVVPLPQASQDTHRHNIEPVHPPHQCHIWPGTIPQVTPQMTSSHPQFGTLPTAAAPQSTFGAFDNAHALSLHRPLSPSHSGGSSYVSLDGRIPRAHAWQGAISQVLPQTKTSSLTTNRQPNFHPPAVDHQLTFDAFDGAYQLSSSLLSTSSSGIECSGGEWAAPLSSVQDQNVPFLMMSGQASVRPSLTPVNPISGSPINTSIPIVPMGSVPVAAAPTTTFARAEPRQVATSRGLCPECHGVRPLVRVDNTIEWVRPDVMKMVVYFNFSSNAETEAHSSWEHRGA